MADKEKMALRQARLSHRRLLEVLSYDPATGVFRWLVSTSNRVKVGAQAGRIQKGARIISVDGTKFLAHRLAWFYVYGVWPADQIDHEDLNQDHNAISNLRESTQAENARNVRVRRHAKSGMKGAHWHKGARRWMSQIVVDGQNFYLGLFDEPEAAAAAYAAASQNLHGKFGRVA